MRIISLFLVFFLSPTILVEGGSLFGDSASGSIQFFLWTPLNSIHPEVLGPNAFKSIYFRPNLPTKFIVHGYRDVGDTNWILRAKDEYLMRENCNVISLDWRDIASENYISAVWHLKDVAKVGKVFLSRLQNARSPRGLLPSSLHPVGFSLGAHVVGILGKMMNQSIPRITGLDPAKPILDILPSSWKLDRRSASIVDVIHGAGHYLTMTNRVGTIDFFPNGGIAPQPGCKEESLDMVCSHVRTADLFVESINSPFGFKSRQCGSWDSFQRGQCRRSKVNWMGEPVISDLQGTFYLPTRSHSPFAIP